MTDLERAGEQVQDLDTKGNDHDYYNHSRVGGILQCNLNDHDYYQSETLFQCNEKDVGPIEGNLSNINEPSSLQNSDDKENRVNIDRHTCHGHRLSEPSVVLETNDSHNLVNEELRDDVLMTTIAISDIFTTSVGDKGDVLSFSNDEEFKDDFLLTNLDTYDEETSNSALLASPSHARSSLNQIGASGAFQQSEYTDTSLNFFLSSSKSPNQNDINANEKVVSLKGSQDKQHQTYDKNSEFQISQDQQSNAYFPTGMGIVACTNHEHFLSEKAPFFYIPSQLNDINRNGSNPLESHSISTPQVITNNVTSVELSSDNSVITKPTNSCQQEEQNELSDIFSANNFEEASVQTCFNDQNSRSASVSESHDKMVVNLDSECFEQTWADSGMFGFTLTDLCTQKKNKTEGQSTLGALETNAETVTFSSLTEGISSTAFPDVQDPTNEVQIHYDQDNDYLSNDNLYSAFAIGNTDIFLEGTSSGGAADYYSHNSMYDSYYQQEGQTYPASNYNDWSSWPEAESHGGCSSEVKSALRQTISSEVKSALRQSILSPSKPMMSWYNQEGRDEAITPDIVEFLQGEVKVEVDDEETDDADECHDLSNGLKPTTGSLDRGVESSGFGSYFSDDNSVSPMTLTPPPSASSTPVPPGSHESQSSDTGFLSSWSAGTRGHAMTSGHSQLSMAFAPYKLTTDRLESGLLTYGLNKSTKRPFPSMADMMRSSQSNRKKYTKKLHLVDKQVPKRCGRPRKNDIQSDKISTSTGKSLRGRKKFSENPSENVQENVNTEDGSTDVNSGDQASAGKKQARHNEPLNQHAIRIMSQWFDDHLESPYPSKADKEWMAREGHITESQVKSWFANKRNRTNNTKPKVQRRAMQKKLTDLFQDLTRSHLDPRADNTHLMQQLTGIIQHCHASKQQ